MSYFLVIIKNRTFFINKKGLTQEQIAAKAYLNAKYYNRIELGKSIPTITTFFKICRALKIKPEKFMHLIDNYNISK